MGTALQVRQTDGSGPASYYRARYYDPSAGRFLSEDPLRFFAGEVNFYPYGESNPTNLIDPLGFDPICGCRYSQSTGRLTCFDIFTGVRYADGYGYAGFGDGALDPNFVGPMPNGKNNPDWNDVPNLGPLPRGNYGIGQTADSKKTGKGTITLTFHNETTDPWPKKRGKRTMRIHGDSDRHPGKASEGCIVIKSDVRRSITENCGPGSSLTVGP
jgi:RHS repeat-associated protein